MNLNHESDNNIDPNNYLKNYGREFEGTKTDKFKILALELLSFIKTGKHTNQFYKMNKKCLCKNFINKEFCKYNIEGRCIPEGYIKPDSVSVLTYTSGNVNNEMIDFQVTYECEICYPVEGYTIECIAKTITKAGIHGQVKDENGNIPINVFIARDHHISDNYFGSIKEEEKFLAVVIGVRFELNDPYVSVIASLKKEVPTNRRRSQSEQTNSNGIFKVASGIGFFVSKDGHIITNHHVIEGCKRVKVHLGGRSLESLKIADDKANDLALLKISEKPSHVFSLSKESPYPTQEILVAGYPFGDNISSTLKFTQGISKFNRWSRK